MQRSRIGLALLIASLLGGSPLLAEEPSQEAISALREVESKLSQARVKLRNWQADVNVRYELKNARGDANVNEIAHAMQVLCDFPGKRSRVVLTRPGPHRIERNGMQLTIEGPKIERYVFAHSGDIWLSEYGGESIGEQRIFQRVERHVQRQWNMPMAYFSYDRLTDPINRVLDVLARPGRVGETNSTVEVDENIVSIKITIAYLSHGGHKYAYDFDLNQSGNMVRYTVPGESVEIDYVLVDGCHVPAKWKQSSGVKYLIGHRDWTYEFTFSNHHVNNDLDEHAFTPLGMGMRAGDLLDDQINFRHLTYEQVVENPMLAD